MCDFKVALKVLRFLWCSTFVNKESEPRIYWWLTSQGKKQCKTINRQPRKRSQSLARGIRLQEILS